MKRARLFGALALLVGILAVNAPANAYHSWNNFHWPRTANPLTLKYTAPSSSTWSGLTTTVIGKWDTVNTLKAGTADVFNFQKVSSGAKVTIESKNYGNNGWFGLAEVSVNLLTGHISSGKVKVNDYYFTGTYGNNTAREHVLCQEVGHVLGLDHQKLALLFGKSCMEDANSTLNDAAYKSPNAHDAEQLNIIYTHKDSGGTLGVTLGPVRTFIIDVIPA